MNRPFSEIGEITLTDGSTLNIGETVAMMAANMKADNLDFDVATLLNTQIDGLQACECLSPEATARFMGVAAGLLILAHEVQAACGLVPALPKEGLH